MLYICKWITLWHMLLLTTPVIDGASYSARKREEPSLSSRARYYPSSRRYSLFRQSRYYAASRYPSSNNEAGRSNSYPAGTFKRTAYTGRFCAYSKTQMVPHKVPNGTETYLKQVRSKCSWSAVYCTPRVSYVVSTRRTFKTVMKKVTKEVWECCPGFEGENCDNTCYNCTTMNDLKERVAALEEQVIGGSVGSQTNEPRPSSGRGNKGLKGESGPVGPRGPTGEKGEVGPRGPMGRRGPKGDAGLSGVPGEVGPRGPMGSPGQKGERGQKGQRGQEGMAGRDGLDGADGLDGPPGQTGVAGIPGLRGLDGQRGVPGNNGAPGAQGIPGPTGPRGLDGSPGRQGQQGPPGPPGQCGCHQAGAPTVPPTTTTTAPKETTSGYAACFYAGQYRNEDEMWTNENCEQCFCMDGAVSCLQIACPDLDCKYKYRPEGYCCDICCRYQNEFGGDYPASGDGGLETLGIEYDDDDYSSYGNASDIEYPLYAFKPMNDTYGCPVPPLSNSSETNATIDRCEFQKDSGPCSRRYQRYYFDKVQQSCRLFTYGGCEGNANSFLTLEECRNACGDVITRENAPAAIRETESPTFVKELSPRCYEPMYRGDCKMTLVRFYYDVDEDRCKKFIYGGCHGNRNRFITPWDCRDTCGGGDPVIYDDSDICSMPPQPGPCRASHPRYYYDQRTRRCEEFVWGGCEVPGPENRFTTEEECLQTCQDPSIETRSRPFLAPECTEPLHPGPCQSHIYRYYYDSVSEKCSVFVFGGCNENGNNFATPEACKRECGALSVNYTVAEPTVTHGGSQRGERGPPGPPGIGSKGDAGPPGLPGPKGESASLDSYIEEIRSLKAEVAELTNMILSHVSDMEKHIQPAAPSDEVGSEYEDGESKFTEPPVDYLTNFGRSK